MNLENDDEPIWDRRQLKRWLKKEIEARSLRSVVTWEIQNLLDQAKRAGITIQKIGKIGVNSGQLAGYLQRGYEHAAKIEDDPQRAEWYRHMTEQVNEARQRPGRFTPVRLRTLLLAAVDRDRKDEQS